MIFSAAAAVFVVSMLSSLVSKREHYVSIKHVMNVSNVSFQTKNAKCDLDLVRLLKYPPIRKKKLKRVLILRL